MLSSAPASPPESTRVGAWAAGTIDPAPKPAVVATPRAARIAILFHDFAAGGSERIMVRLANAWVGVGRQVEILCGSGRGPSRALVGPGVRVTELRPAIPRGFGSRLRLGRAVRRLLPHVACDVLVAPGNFHLLPLWAMGRAAVPIVCKLSNPVRGHGMEGALSAWAARLACARVDALAGMSPALAAEARAMLPGHSISVLPQPNLPDAADLPRGRAPRHPLRLLAAGRLVPQKRFDLAIRVLAQLPEESRLSIAGEGPERERLQRLANRLGISNRVRFTGHVPDLSPLLAVSDLFLLTSDYEGFPGVVIEALAAGVPVVATPASPALREMLIHPSFGCIVQPDETALAKAIGRLVDCALPPDASARRRLLAPLTTDHAGRCWLDFLDGVVERHLAGSPARP